MAEKGTLYMIPCPISDSTAVYDVVPEANRRVIDSLDYFIVENVRSARRFLSKAGIQRKIDELEFVELNEHTTAGAAVEAMVKPLAGSFGRCYLRGWCAGCCRSRSAGC